MSVFIKRIFVIKSFFDKILALILIVISSPILLIVALVIRFKIGKPILFRQDRPGLNGAIFEIYKFRTMNNKTNINGELLSDEERLLGVGRTIRVMSLDELPQLFNILKGDMSFIGPRPLLVEYLPLYSIKQHKRHDVKPGITGWAQVNGRNAISWEKKFEYDIWYTEHQTFWLDMKIIGLTFLKVLKTKDINAPSSVGMKKFKGNSS